MEHKASVIIVNNKYDIIYVIMQNTKSRNTRKKNNLGYLCVVFYDTNYKKYDFAKNSYIYIYIYIIEYIYKKNLFQDL